MIEASYLQVSRTWRAPTSLTSISILGK